MLTLEKLKAMQPNEVIDCGIAPNSPEGIFMTDSNIGKELLWVAKRGRIHDWTIYCHWKEKGMQYVLDCGDKITSKANIQKLVLCDDEAFKMYRF